jgi:hypothetical protein
LLIFEEHRAEVHLRIDRALLLRMMADQLAEHLFDICEPAQSRRRTSDSSRRKGAGSNDQSKRRAKGQGVGSQGVRLFSGRA